MFTAEWNQGTISELWSVFLVFVCG